MNEETRPLAVSSDSNDNTHIKNNINNLSNDGNGDDNNNDPKASVPYAFMSGLFDVAQHRYIVGVWLVLVFSLNIMSSLVVTSTRPKTPVRYVNSWPPQELMKNVIDNSNRVVVVIVNHKADVKLADNFLASLERSGVFNFCVVPLHPETYQALVTAYPRHVLPPMPSVDPFYDYNSVASSAVVSDGEASGDGPPAAARTSSPPPPPYPPVSSKSFDDVVHILPNILHAFARAGYTLFCGDIHSVWRTNAFSEVNEIVALQNTVQGGPPNDRDNFDAFFFLDDSVSTDLRQNDHLSSTQMFLRPTPATLDFLERWVRHRDTLLLGDDRHAFNGLIRAARTLPHNSARQEPYRWGDRVLASLLLRFGDYADENSFFRIAIGERYKYPSGWMYDSQTEEERNAVSIVHNARVDHLQNAGLWQPSGRLQK